jgi:hypothetical protein
MVVTLLSEGRVTSHGTALFAYSPKVKEGVSLLKKSLWDQSVVQNRIQTLRHQGQNTAMAGFLSP